VVKKVLVPLANGTEEIEAVTVIDILRRADLNVLVAGLGKVITCSRGVRIIPDISIDEISEEMDFDAIVLPGGLEGTEKLSESLMLKSLLLKHRKMGRLIGAICAAPLVLDRVGVLENGAMITSHPTVSEDLSQYEYMDETIVVDGKIISSRGAGTALEFALKIVELLVDNDCSDKISKSILYDR